jgi:hypothetical protein
MIRIRWAMATLVVALELGAPATTHAQRVVRLTHPSGTPVEVIGLRRWSVAMIEDSIAKYAPGESFVSHACQAVLQYKLGFPSASVHWYMLEDSSGKEASALVVTLVEPQDSARLAWRRVTTSERARVAAWADLYAPVTATYDSTKPPAVVIGYLSGALQLAHLRGAWPESQFRGYLEHVPETLRDSFTAFADRLGRRTREADVALARETLRADGRVENRMLAAAVLSNFATRPEAWHALVGALTDREEAVRGAAEVAMQKMRSGPKGPIDWRPVVPQLRAVLGGAGVAAIDPLLAVLLDTKVPRALAAELLAGNGELVLARASLTVAWANQNARTFLAHASGKPDAGVGVDAWAAWLRELEAPRPRSG